MIQEWVIRVAVVVVMASIPICAFYAFYYNNPVWFIPAALAFVIIYAG